MTTVYTVHLRVMGMMCQKNCGTTVENALRSIPGALEVHASFAQSYAKITAQAEEGEPWLEENAVDAVECVGFDAEIIPTEQLQDYLYPPHSVHMRVTGMMCQKNCGSTVENALKALPGVVNAEASFSRSYAMVTARLGPYAASPENDDTLSEREANLEEQAVDAVEMVGFDAEIISEPPEHDASTASSSEHQSPDEEQQPLTDDKTALLQVNGMSCAICVGRVEELLKSIDGVVDATVVLTTHRAQIRVDLSTDIHATADVCAGVVTQGGYEARVLQAGSGGRDNGLSLIDSAAQLEDSRKHEMNMWGSLLFLSVALTLPMVMIHYRLICLSMKTRQLVMLILATLAQVYVGKRYYMAAWKGWSHGRYMGMDFLIVMGTTASYVYSVLVFVAKTFDDDSFENLEPTFVTGAMLFTFVTFGKLLEAYAKGKTASALKSLMELQPHAALRVVSPDQGGYDHAVDLTSLETEEVTASEIKNGDYLYVLPGARIPADGTLVATSDKCPHAFVDESALSGEPFPVAKPVGGQVFGATINQLSTLLIRVTASGGSTVLAKIVQLMERAQSQKAPIQAQADRIACVFAPTVLSLSGITLLGWLIFFDGPNKVFLAIMSAISVIVVACPCALGLATPTAVMVGTGVGASHGLLIKGGAVMEGAHSVDTVVFDKTGTLTTGKAVVQDMVQFINDTHNEALLMNIPKVVPSMKVALWLAACAEKQSEHPLGKAIVNAARNIWGGDVTCSTEGVEVSDFHVAPGSGVECLVRKPSWGEWHVRVGSRSWTTEPLREDDVVMNENVGDDEVRQMREQGRVGVYISACSEGDIRRRVIGALGIADPIEAEAKSTVAALRNMGVDVWMCTGDDEVTALAVARHVGLDEPNVCAGVKPEGKADLVTRLQKQQRDGHRRGKRDRGHVAVVGDGINDAVALARADVGIAIGAGTEVAMEAADMVLVKSSLHDVVVALHLSRVVFQRIRLNFVWAMGYNLFALPFAAGVFYPFMKWRLPPEFAGLMMAFSSVSVVTSSLLLRAYSKPIIETNGQFQKSAPWIRSFPRGCRESCQSLTKKDRLYKGISGWDDDDGFESGHFEIV